MHASLQEAPYPQASEGKVQDLVAVKICSSNVQYKISKFNYLLEIKKYISTQNMPHRK